MQSCWTYLLNRQTHSSHSGLAITGFFAKVNCIVNVCPRIPHFQPAPIHVHNSSNTAAYFAKPGAAFVIPTESTHQFIISPAGYGCSIDLFCPCSYAGPIIKAVHLQAHTYTALFQIYDSRFPYPTKSVQMNDMTSTNRM